MHPYLLQNNTFSGHSGGYNALFTAPHRFSFNGKENDDEVKGKGNWQDYGMRMYDTRLGRFFSVDPLTKAYPWYSSYQFAGNKPIWKVDVDGLEEGETPKTVYYATINNVNESFVMNLFVMQMQVSVFNLVSRTAARADQQYSNIVVYKKMDVVVDEPGGVPYKVVHTVVESPFQSLVETTGDVLTLYPSSPKAGPLVMMAKTPAKNQIIQEVKAITRTFDDLSTLRGAAWEEIENLIPKNWIRGPLKKGEGIKFVNPAKKGEQILLERGTPGATDPLHAGPYVKVSMNGKVERIPLEGNPTLN